MSTIESLNSVTQTMWQGIPVIELKNAVAIARISLFGGQVLSFETQFSQKPILWCKSAPLKSVNRPIRGGIPICWPWFGADPENQKRPQHGIARTADWTLLSSNEQSSSVILGLSSDNLDNNCFKTAFNLELKISLQEAVLQMSLSMQNCEQEKFLDCSYAFHAYFAVSDCIKVQIPSLLNHSYLDALAPSRIPQKLGSPFLCDNGCDLIFDYPEENVDIIDSRYNRVIQIRKTGFPQLVVWNPGVEKGLNISDVPPSQLFRFLCVEPTRVQDSLLRIPPMEKREITMTVTEHEVHSL